MSSWSWSWMTMVCNGSLIVHDGVALFISTSMTSLADVSEQLEARVVVQQQLQDYHDMLERGEAILNILLGISMYCA